MSRITLKRDESLFLRELSLFLVSQNLDDSLHDITFTATRLTNDYSFLTIFFTIFDLDNHAKYKELLDKYKKTIRSHLALTVNPRQMPELIFKFDESLQYGNKIEQILSTLKKD